MTSGTVFSQQPGQEGLRRFGVSMPLKENIEHEAVLVHCAPQPMPNAVDARADFIQIPAGTPPGFPLAQFFRKQGTEFDAPLPERLVTDLDTALVESFLNVSVAQGEAVIEPDGVLDDTHRKAAKRCQRRCFGQEAVAVGLDVSHGGSAYPGTIKPTQPGGHPVGICTLALPDEATCGVVLCAATLAQTKSRPDYEAHADEPPPVNGQNSDSLRCLG